MKIRLSEGAVVKVKPEPEKRVELWDTLQQGLHLRISPKGKRNWYLRAMLSNGRYRRFQLGYFVTSKKDQYSDSFDPSEIEPGPKVPLTLPQARAVAGVQRTLIAANRDPAAERKARRTTAKEATSRTVEALAEEFIEYQKQQGVKTWFEQKRQIEKDITPVIGELSVSEVTPQEVQTVVDRILKRGKRMKLTGGGKVQANRTRSLTVQLFNFALRDPDWRHLLQGNPALVTVKPLKSEPPRDRELTDDELKKLWKAAEDLEPVIRAAFRLRTVSGQRWEEIRAMRWDELRHETYDLDRMKGKHVVWQLPAHRTKAKRAHVLPLPHQAVAIIEELRPLTGDSEFVFESPRKPGQPISRVNKAFRKWKADAKVEDFIGVDLRRTVATGMARLGVRGEVIAAVMNHAPDTITRKVYNRYDLLPEKLTALQRWADHIDHILKGKDEELAEVVELANHKV